MTQSQTKSKTKAHAGGKLTVELKPVTIGQEIKYQVEIAFWQHGKEKSIFISTYDNKKTAEERFEFLKSYYELK